VNKSLRTYALLYSLLVSPNRQNARACPRCLKTSHQSVELCLLPPPPPTHQVTVLKNDKLEAGVEGSNPPGLASLRATVPPDPTRCLLRGVRRHRRSRRQGRSACWTLTHYRRVQPMNLSDFLEDFLIVREKGEKKRFCGFFKKFFFFIIYSFLFTCIPTVIPKSSCVPFTLKLNKSASSSCLIFKKIPELI